MKIRKNIRKKKLYEPLVENTFRISYKKNGTTAALSFI